MPESKPVPLGSISEAAARVQGLCDRMNSQPQFAVLNRNITAYPDCDWTHENATAKRVAYENATARHHLLAGLRHAAESTSLTTHRPP